jgi:DNA polymerase elongation subunit (family B)
MDVAAAADVDVVFITKYLKSAPGAYAIDKYGNSIRIEIDYSRFVHIQVLIEDRSKFESAVKLFAASNSPAAAAYRLIERIDYHENGANLRSCITPEDVLQNKVVGESCCFIYLTVYGQRYINTIGRFLELNKRYFGIYEVSSSCAYNSWYHGNRTNNNTLHYFRHHKRNNREFQPFSSFDLKTQKYITAQQQTHHHNIPKHKICSFDIEMVSDKETNSFPTGCGLHDRIVAISVVVEIVSDSIPSETQRVDTICFLLLPPTCNDKEEEEELILTLQSVGNKKFDVRYFSTEFELLSTFCKFMYTEMDASIIIGYNILNFDLPVLLNRMIFYGIAFQYHNIKTINSGINSNSASFIFGEKFQIIDVFLAIKEMYSRDYESFSLNSMAKTILGESKDDISFSKLNVLYQEDNDTMGSNDRQNANHYQLIDKLCRYVIKDSEICLNLYTRLKIENDILPILNVCYCDAIDYHKNISGRIRSFFTVEFPANGMLCPKYITERQGSQQQNCNTTYEGATVLKARRAIHTVSVSNEKLFVLDFTSLYPNIIREFNLSHGYVFTDSEHNLDSSSSLFRKVGQYYTLNSAIFSSPLAVVVNVLLDRRKECQNSGNCSLANAYKKTVNSIYGNLALSKETLYLAMLVTLCGRNIHKQVCDFISDQTNFCGDKVVLLYGDTDSFFIKCIDGYSVLQRINEDFIKGALQLTYISLSVDYVATIVIFLAEKKSYLLQLENKKIIKRGLQRKQISTRFIEHCDQFISNLFDLIYKHRNEFSSSAESVSTLSETGQMKSKSVFLKAYETLVWDTVANILNNSRLEEYVFTCNYRPFFEYSSMNSFPVKCSFRYEKHIAQNTEETIDSHESDEIRYCIILSSFDKTNNRGKKKDSFEFFDNVIKYNLRVDRVEYIERVFNFLSNIEKHILDCNIFLKVCAEFRQKETFGVEPQTKSLFKPTETMMWYYRYDDSRITFYYDKIFTELSDINFSLWENRDLNVVQTLLTIDSSFNLRHVNGVPFIFDETKEYMRLNKLSKLNVLLHPVDGNDVKVRDEKSLLKFLSLFYVQKRRLNQTDCKESCCYYYIEPGILIIYEKLKRIFKLIVA